MSADAASLTMRRAARDMVVVVTGASGLGLESALQLAKDGAEIVMICRDRTRGEQAHSRVIRAATGKPPLLILADLPVQPEVRAAAQEIKTATTRSTS
jgi:retinol dehydrogenase-12